MKRSFLYVGIVIAATLTSSLTYASCTKDSACPAGQVCNAQKAGDPGACTKAAGTLSCTDNSTSNVSGTTTLDSMISTCSSHGGIKTWDYKVVGNIKAMSGQAAANTVKSK